MAFGAGWFPTNQWLFVIIHLITAAAAFYYSSKLKSHNKVMWAFVLYGITGLLYTMVHLGWIDNYFTHVTETVLVFIAFLMIGMSMTKR